MRMASMFSRNRRTSSADTAASGCALPHGRQQVADGVDRAFGEQVGQFRRHLLGPDQPVLQAPVVAHDSAQKVDHVGGRAPVLVELSADVVRRDRPRVEGRDLFGGFRKRHAPHALRRATDHAERSMKRLRKHYGILSGVSSAAQTQGTHLNLLAHTQHKHPAGLSPLERLREACRRCLPDTT